MVKKAFLVIANNHVNLPFKARIPGQAPSGCAVCNPKNPQKSKANSSLWRIFVTLLVLFNIYAVGAAETDTPYSDIVLTLKNIHSDSIINASVVNLVFTNMEKGTRIKFTRPLNPEGELSYKLTGGRWKLELTADYSPTPEMDFFVEDDLTIEEGDVLTKTLYLYPVGALEGKVTDHSGNLIGGAELKFNCKPNLDLAYKNKTDKFGTFQLDIAPAGKCKVSAAYNNLVGEAEAEIRQGDLSLVTISLTEPVLSSYSWLYLTGFVVFILLAYLIFGFIKKKKKQDDRVQQKKKPKKQAKSANKKSESNVAEWAVEVKGEEPKTVTVEHMHVETPRTIETTASESLAHSRETEDKGELNPRARDIMKTLNEREAKIATFLLGNNHKSTQASIRNGTGIPKTSLARSFAMLESKNVVKIETIGKLKKVELTDWFLGKG